MGPAGPNAGKKTAVEETARSLHALIALVWFLSPRGDGLFPGKYTPYCIHEAHHLFFQIHRLPNFLLYCRHLTYRPSQRRTRPRL